MEQTSIRMEGGSTIARGFEIRFVGSGRADPPLIHREDEDICQQLRGVDEGNQKDVFLLA